MRKKGVKYKQKIRVIFIFCTLTSAYSVIKYIPAADGKPSATSALRRDLHICSSDFQRLGSQGCSLGGRDKQQGQ